MAQKLSDDQRDLLMHHLFRDPYPRVPGRDSALKPVLFTETDVSPQGYPFEMDPAALWERSNIAGERDAETCVTRPSNVVSDGEVIDVLPDGALGMCLISIQSGHPFARWLKRMQLADTGSRGTVIVAIAHHTQSVHRATAHGLTVARLLLEAGVLVLRVEPEVD